MRVIVVSLRDIRRDVLTEKFASAGHEVINILYTGVTATQLLGQQADMGVLILPHEDFLPNPGLWSFFVSRMRIPPLIMDWNGLQSWLEARAEERAVLARERAADTLAAIAMSGSDAFERINRHGA